MKKLNRIHGLWIFAMVMGIGMLISTQSNGQNKSKDETLALYPEKVSGVFANSCVGCHNDTSEGKAKEFLNFSSWDKLDAKAQAKTSKGIAKVIRKGIMPPADLLEKYPQMAVNPENAKIVNDWATSVKNSKK
jgi:mono/diheme cytochrome c family protein